MMEEKFYEGDYYIEFKKVRNRFRKYDSVKLIEHAINFLYQKPQEDLKKQPWNIFLLIKWILIDDEFYLKNKKEPSSRDFLNIIQLVIDLGNKVKMPTLSDDIALFMRQFAFQQFYLQTSFNLAAFSRQFFLFDELPENHKFKKEFYRTTGVYIDDFLAMSIFLNLTFTEKLKPIKLNDFERIFGSQITREKFETFLNAISLDIDAARNFAISKTSKNRISNELYEQTVFINNPILKIDEIYYPYYRAVVFRGLEYYIYDTLKASDKEYFMNKFGGLFENYIKRLLKYSKVNFLKEEDLKKVLPRKSKVVDFLVQEGKNNIFIDAKAVEMQYSGKINFEPSIIRRAVKSSLVKGIDQAFEMAENLSSLNEYESIKNKDNNFLIIITYKELYILNGLIFEQSLDTSTIENIKDKYGKELKIPLKNIYFIPIDSFEYWIELVKEKKITFTEGLIKARENDSKPQSHKMEFSQHVRSWESKIEYPKFLTSKFNSVLRSLLNKETIKSIELPK